MKQVTYGDLKNIKYTTQEGVASPIMYSSMYGQLDDSCSLPFYHKQEVDDLLKAKEDKTKVEIPQYVADYIERDYPFSACELFSIDNGAMPDSVKKWLYYNTEEKNDRRCLLAIQAAVTGEYEAIEEQLYEIVIVEITNNRLLLFSSSSGLFAEWESDNEGLDKQRFTENEINEMEKDYWGLAVPVKA